MPLTSRDASIGMTPDLRPELPCLDLPSAAREFSAAFSGALDAPALAPSHVLDAATRELACAARRASLAPEDGVMTLKALVRTAARGWMPSLVRTPADVTPPAAALYARVFGQWVAAYYHP